jgi:hypothetical protein
LRDNGTVELQRKRALLVNGSGGTSLASSLADVLFANKVLDAYQRNAAIRFKALRERVFPHPLRNATGGAMPTEERMAETDRLYDKLAGRLDEEQKLAVVDLILENRASWMRRHLLGVPLTADDELDKRALLLGRRSAIT